MYIYTLFNCKKKEGHKIWKMDYGFGLVVTYRIKRDRCTPKTFEAVNCLKLLHDNSVHFVLSTFVKQLRLN